MPVPPVTWTYQARCLRLIDGDTLHVEVDLGFRSHIRTPVRLLGVNAPELSTPEGQAALTWVAGWMAGAGVSAALTIQSAHPGDYSGDKYGRWLATVWRSDGACLNDDLLASGHAVPMKG